MSTYLPVESCFSCADSPLSVTASVVGILTFVFAVAASIRLFTSRVKHSPEELKQLFDSTSNSIDAMRLATDSLQRLEKLADNDALLRDMEINTPTWVRIFVSMVRKRILIVQNRVLDCHARVGIRNGNTAGGNRSARSKVLGRVIKHKKYRYLSGT